ncbi:MAG: DMT family transporter [Acidimicrobiales bacterium]
MAFLLAALAALTSAVTSVLQRIGVESAPTSSTLRLSLMSHAIKRGIWLFGFALMLVQFGLQATALRFGQLSVVQPVLTTELLFLLLILAVWFRYRLGFREWLGAVTVVVGLGGFFLAARPRGGQVLPSTTGWAIASVALISAIALCIVAGMHGPRWWRAAAFGASAAVTAAFGAALTKAITGYVTEGWGHVFTHFQPYMLAVTGIGTVFLIQNALHAGPITASRTTLVTLNPLLSIVLGVTLFGDVLRGGAFWISLEVLALAVLVLGVVILTRSPLVAGADTGGTDDEMLGGARQRSMVIPPIEALP